jgi:hypothetical protein
MEETFMDYPPVTVVMTTYFPEGEIGYKRLDAAELTLASWHSLLYYEGDLRLHIADDGSFICPYINRWKDRDWPDNSDSWQDQQGVGASLNKGFSKAYESSPIVFYGVDDWMLVEEFDITPWVRLLLEREDVGMVRLGPPHPNIRGKVEMFTELWQGWGLRLDRYAYAYGQRPALYHKRFTDAYGWFKEDVSAIDCEKEYAESFVQSVGPDIVFALPHPWLHIDTISMSSMTPGE